jgi:hypothetical protein
MATVAAEPLALPVEALEAIGKIEAALKPCAEKHKVKVRCSIYNKKLDEVWGTQMEGVPGFMKAVAKSKARSFFEGKTLANPGGCTTMCCYLMPWCCGCSSQMAVQGTVAYELPGTDGAALVVNGAPSGAVDLEIANELVGAAAGGAPGGATMER